MRDRLALQIIVVEHQAADFIGHGGEQNVALLAGHVAGGDDTVEHDLDIDFVVGCIDAGRIVDEIGVDAAAGLSELDAAELGHAQISALADDLAAKLARRNPDGVVGAVADIEVGLAPCLDIGADAAEPQQVHLRFQQRADELVRRHAVLGKPEARLHLRRHLDRLRLAVENAAALGNERRVVVAPARARQVEQPAALGVARLGVGIGVDENVEVIEGGEEADVFAQEHAVAEHVAGHVADADDGEVLALGVMAAFAEVALDGFPGAAGRDAHLLMIVSGRAAGGEGVAEPETVLRTDLVGEVGELGGALVGGDHQIGIVLVKPDHTVRRYAIVACEIVGEIEHAADERFVAVHDFFLHGLARTDRRQALAHEAALGADRHDDGVLHHLRLHEPKHLRTKILAPVGPAQAAAGHRAAAQMDAFHARAVDEDLAPRPRRRQLVDGRAVELE